MVAASSPKGTIPDDLIVQILARLPVKDLFRFRSVCKFWYGLPSDRHFVQVYNQFSSKNPMVLIQKHAYSERPSFVCVDGYGGLPQLSLDFLRGRVTVRASCNGLLCCTNTSSWRDYYVCNPMTRDFKLLPIIRDRHVSCFHPDDEDALVGLGFEPSTGKFYVALAGFYQPFGRRPIDQLACFLYDSETNAWRKFLSPLDDKFTRMNRIQAVYASGSLHWLTNSCSYVLALDLAGRFWRRISLPETIRSTVTGKGIYLLDMEGSVSVAVISMPWMSIWVLTDYTREEWAMVERVHLRCVSVFVPDTYPICLTRDLIFLATEKKILAYVCKDKVWKEVYAVKDGYTFPLWFSSFPFRSTLFSCNQDAELLWRSS